LSKEFTRGLVREDMRAILCLALFLYFIHYTIGENIHVHVVAHSHDDPGLSSTTFCLKYQILASKGWLKTMEGSEIIKKMFLEHSFVNSRYYQDAGLRILRRFSRAFPHSTRDHRQRSRGAPKGRAPSVCLDYPACCTRMAATSRWKRVSWRAGGKMRRMLRKLSSRHLWRQGASRLSTAVGS